MESIIHHLLRRAPGCLFNAGAGIRTFAGSPRPEKTPEFSTNSLFFCENFRKFGYRFQNFPIFMENISDKNQLFHRYYHLAAPDVLSASPLDYPPEFEFRGA